MMEVLLPVIVVLGRRCCRGKEGGKSWEHRARELDGGS